jgi:beta-lactamase regulating signal transducer with metallopeptidase domain
LFGSLLLLLPISLPQAPAFYLQTLTNPVIESSVEILPSSVSLEATDSISSVSTSQRAAAPAFNNDTGVGSNALLVDSTGQGQAAGLAANPSSSSEALFLKVSNSLSAIPFSYWLIVIWGLGSSLALTRLYLGYRRGMLQLGTRQLIDDCDPIVKLFHELCEEAGIRKQPRLTRSEKFVSPVTLLGNEICLPGWVDHSFPESELKSLLAHELGHVRHHDLTVLLGLQLLTCLFFFQPLFTLARNRLVDLSEFLADRAALDHCENSDVITTALINCASRMDSEKPFKWGFAMIGNTSRLKLRILQLQNAGRLTTGRFSKSGRVVVLTAICAVVLLTPTVQIETKADVAASPERIELVKDRQAELEIVSNSLETFDSVNTPETEDFALIRQASAEKSELSEPDNEQIQTLEENIPQPIQQAIVQQDEEIEIPRRQFIEINQRLLAQNQQQRLQEEQRQQNLQESQLHLQELNLQQQFFTEENLRSTYLLLNYSEIGLFDVTEIVLTESESKKEFRILNIQSIKRGDKNYILTDIKPGNYYVSGFYVELPSNLISSPLGGRIDIDDEDALIEVVENSINYIGDIRVDSRAIPGGVSISNIRKFELSPNASTLLAAASDRPELFRSKDVVASIASNDPVIIDKNLLGISR